MALTVLAEVVLIAHLLLAALITLGLIAIPVGGVLQWPLEKLTYPAPFGTEA